MKTLSVHEAREIDTDAVERLGMPSILLMENAARGVAEHAAQLGERFVILCGPGNNGGDGLAAARHLGPSRCRIFLLAEPDPRKCPDAALQLEILRRAGVTVDVDADPSPDLEGVWIDALFGTGLTRAVEGRAAGWIETMRTATGPKLAVDIPSGLDGDLGHPLGSATVRADVTVTFLAAKTGLVAAEAQPFVGRIEVVGLGLP